jgi:type IV pilus assembly protein PilB
MKKKLGELLVQSGVLTPEQLEQALALQRDEKGLLGEILLRLGFVRQADLGRALAEQHGVPFVALETEDTNPQVALLLPESFCRQRLLAPFRVCGDTLSVAMVAPDDLWAVSETEHLTGYLVEPFVASASAILRVLDRCFDRKLLTRQTIIDMRLEELKRGGAAHKSDLLAAEAIDSSDAPVIRLVNSILTGGIRAGASDVHFEPQHPEMRVRYRVDGVLYDNMNIPRHIETPLVSRLKVMADLDITERRHPQDGHISYTTEKKTYDLRVSTMPTVAGEKVVIRVLEKDADLFRLARLGFSPAQQQIVDHFLSHPYGMLLVTGPTGSGKSTTLYAALNQLNRTEKNIITLEDPVENQIHGMNQITVDPNYGMSFAEGLKYILRQDPNIIMVGEIRDGETAQIAVQSALTGHLLLSTLHTNNAAAAPTRLTDLGVQPFLIASSLIGVVAQRLLRRVCSGCRSPRKPDPELLAGFGPYASRLEGAETCVGVGCDRCLGTGYRGRVGVFELMLVSPALALLVERRASSAQIQEHAVREGMKTLTDAALDKALSGDTTLEEVRERVLVWETTEEEAAVAQ